MRDTRTNFGTSVETNVVTGGSAASEHCGIGTLRLLTLGMAALTDNTEGRSASISWEMFQSGDLITPRLFLKGELVPFWGKPPLQFWMTSLSFQLFGVSEGSARLPNTLLGIVIVLMTMRFTRQFAGRREALLSGVILASSGLFFALAFLPWIPLMVQAWTTKLRDWRLLFNGQCDVWMLYAALWGLTPTVFFTVARQIQITYVLPGLPGMAVLMAVGLVRWMESPRRHTLLIGLRNQSVITSMLLLAAIVAAVMLDAPLEFVVGSSIAAMVLMAAMRTGLRHGDPESLVASIGLANSLLIAIAVCAGSGQLSDHHSTRTILAEVARIESERARRVMFPFGDPCSADIYQSGMFGGRVDRSIDRDEPSLCAALDADPERVFVFKKPAWAVLASDLKLQLEPVRKPITGLPAPVVACSPGSSDRDNSPAFDAHHTPFHRHRDQCAGNRARPCRARPCRARPCRARPCRDSPTDDRTLNDFRSGW